MATAADKKARGFGIDHVRSDLISQVKHDPEETARLNRIFDKLNSYPGGFSAEFELRMRQQGPMKRLE